MFLMWRALPTLALKNDLPVETLRAEIFLKVVAFLKKYMFAMASCLYLFTFGFFLIKNRSLINTICEHFGYKVIVPTIIPQITLGKAVSDIGPMQLLEIGSQFGNVYPLELVVIAKLVLQQKPKHALEIGTFDGRTTLNIAANCEEQAIVYTLDLPREEILNTEFPIEPRDNQFIDKEKSGTRFAGTTYEKKIVQLYGDSARFDFSPYWGKLDFIFIDGSHSYPYVLNDSKMAFKCLRNGQGLIVWHDYNEEQGVTQALDELYTQTAEFKRLRHIEGTSLAYAIFE